MKKDRLLALCSGYAYFDLAFLVQMSGEEVATVGLNVRRWLSADTLRRLRQGLYTLADHLRKADVSTPRLANDLYAPSYLTDVWALAFHALIPDVAREYTSATMRRPQTFTNHLGVFSYRHMSAKYFWGFETLRSGETDFRCATPGKALLDHWHWSRGEWTRDRMREMRLQNLERLNFRELDAAVRRVGKPRIVRAYEALRNVFREEDE